MIVEQELTSVRQELTTVKQELTLSQQMLTIVKQQAVSPIPSAAAVVPRPIRQERTIALTNGEWHLIRGEAYALAKERGYQLSETSFVRDCRTDPDRMAETFGLAKNPSFIQGQNKMPSYKDTWKD